MGKGKETFDLFLVLTRKDNDRVVGESRDAVMSRAGAIEIEDFTFRLEKPSAKDEKMLKKATASRVDPSRITDAKQRSIASTFFLGDEERIAMLEQFLEEDSDSAREDKGSARKGTGSARKKSGRDRSFSIKKDVDRASAALYRAYCEGLTLSGAQAANQPGGSKGGDGSTPFHKPGVFYKAVVYVRKAGGDPDNVYLKFEFEELNVKHYALDVSETDHSEDVEFSFDKVRVTYRDQQETGQLKTADATRVVELDLTKDPKEEPDLTKDPKAE